MAKDKKVSFIRVNLAAGENSYTQPALADTSSFRRLKSLVPSLSGALTREQRPVAFAAAALTGGDPLWLFDFNRQGTHHFFAANLLKLYYYTAGNWSDLSGAGTVSAGTVSPTGKVLDGLLHFTNNTTNSWLFDGTNWIRDGLQIPINAPVFTVTAGAGTPNRVSVNRYYWTTYADHTSGRREHESSSSPRSAATGTVANTGVVDIYQEPGTITTNSGSAAVVGVGTSFNSRHIGMKLYTNGQLQGTITAVANATNLTLTANAATTTAAVRYVIAPARATHWHIYASSSEEDKQGLLLAEVLVTTVTYQDDSPMVGVSGAGTVDFVNIDRPLLNDPPNVTTVAEVFKKRLWRRREEAANKNVFTISAYEEVLAGGAGSPFESVPGADLTNTVSTRSNSDILPDEDVMITAMLKHGDAIWIGTEKQVIPWLGDGIDDFTPSENATFSVGVAGKYCMVSTPYGLVFRSYDHKIYLYPSRYPPQEDATSSLIEIGRPKRNTWKDVSIGASGLMEGGLAYYNWGDRNWLVHWWQKADQSWATWVFDFDIMGWFELQQGYSAIGVFEVAAGEKVLVGANPSDDKIYVIDDQTGTYAGSGNFPAGTYRELVDFGQPNTEFLLDCVEFEKSNDNMEVVVTAYLDPADPNNPSGGMELIPARTNVGANRYRAHFPRGSNLIAQRVLVELSVSASTEDGEIRALSVFAEPLPAQAVV